VFEPSLEKDGEVVAQKEEEHMPLIQWEDRFSVGIRKLDQQHKGLVGMINELHDAMKAGKGQEVVSEIVQRLAAYAKNHFSSEEELFDLHGYPEAARHRQEHALLVEKVAQWQRDLQVGRKGITIEVAHFLRNWLTNHILESDKRYGPFLNAKGVQ